MCIKGEDLARAERYQETLNELGEALLKSADRENRLEYLKGLAACQKASARKSRRKRDWVNYYLNMADYNGTMAKITAVRDEIERIDLSISELKDDVMDCYVSPVDNAEWPDEPAEPADEEVDDFPESDEVLGGDETPEGDVFADTDQPVELEEPTKPIPAVKGDKAEREIDDAS